MARTYYEWSNAIVAILPVAAQTQDAEVTDFRGPWLRPDSSDVPASEALLSLNAEYNPQEVMTRNGFGLLWNPSAVLTTLFNWVKVPDSVSTNGNYLAVYNATAGKAQWVVNLTTPVLTDLFTVAAEGLSCASGGNFLFVASFTLSGAGAAQCRVVGIYSFTVAVDTAFEGPLTAKPVLNNTGVGVVTAGSHFVGYVITSRTGFTGPICPVFSGTNTPDQTSAITAPGGQQIGGTLTPTTVWPADASGVQIVMAAVTNPFQYFIVPGLDLAVLPGTSTPVSFAINISDQQLELGTDVTNNQFLLTQDDLGNGPFNPFCVLIYGQRTVYLAISGSGKPAIFISELSNPQQISAAFGELNLPGFLQICNGFVLGGILYILGPHWTWAYQDNTQEPTTWAAAQLVDGKLGTPCNLGTTVNAAGGWAAVVHVTGLYIFTGQYQDPPLTFMVDSDWRRINWAAAQTIRLSDNKDEKELLVAVPLDGATTPSHLMMFDYTDGVDYQSIRYSLWDIANTGMTPRGLVAYQNDTTKRIEFLMSDGTAGPVVRQKNPTDDGAAWPYDYKPGGAPNQAAINFQWESAPLPQGQVGRVMAHVGAYVRARGSGVPVVTSYGVDRVVSARWSKAIQLSTTPGQDYFRQFYITSERCSTRFASGINPGDYLILAGLRQRFYEWAVRR